MVINGGGSLAALEFADCLTDSPEFRENLNRHEKELDKTSQQIKRIIKEIKDLLQAAKSKFTVYLCVILNQCVVITKKSSSTVINHVMEFLMYIFLFIS